MMIYKNYYLNIKYIMSSDLEQLKQKFDNYKKFIKENSKNSIIIQVFEAYSYKQFVCFGVVLMQYHKNNKLDDIVSKTCAECQIDDEHKDKIKRYYECFCDYLSIIPKEELMNIS